MLTLQEYLTQQEPVYMPMVNLIPAEYTIEHEQLRQIVHIHHYPDYRYMKKGKSNKLYAIKPDGDCESESCFWI